MAASIIVPHHTRHLAKCKPRITSRVFVPFYKFFGGNRDIAKPPAQGGVGLADAQTASLFELTLLTRAELNREQEAFQSCFDRECRQRAEKTPHDARARRGEYRRRLGAMLGHGSRLARP